MKIKLNALQVENQRPLRQRLRLAFTWAVIVCAVAPFAHAKDPEAEQSGDVVVLMAAISAMKEKALTRERVDWGEVEQTGRRKLDDGESLGDVLAWAVERLGDGHSRVLTAQEARMFLGKQDHRAEPAGPSAMPPPLDPSGRLAITSSGCRVAYLRVPYFLSADPPTMSTFAGSLASLQRRLEGEGARAVIIDLRGNVGGNMWPMLAGLSGVLGDGKHGEIWAPDGSRQAWGTSIGAAWAGVPENVVMADESFKGPQAALWPAAVLTDQRTASSGEAIAISFKGRANTRSFGDATRGASSANEIVSLPDGSMIALTTSLMVDRNGKRYGGPITPDVIFNLSTPERGVSPPIEDGKSDPVYEASLQWLDGTCTAKNSGIAYTLLWGLKRSPEGENSLNPWVAVEKPQGAVEFNGCDDSRLDEYCLLGGAIKWSRRNSRGAR